MTSEAAIQAKRVSKSYRLYDRRSDRIMDLLTLFKGTYHRNHAALSDVNLTISKGDIVGIVGRNGSGKSTLLGLFSGVIKPTAGDISVSGRISTLLELGIGFNPALTGIENVYYFGLILGHTRSEMNSKIGDILQFADIGQYAYQPVRTYSSGMFVRLAFAAAINVDPDILLVDEVLAVGDINFQLKCMEKFDEFKERHTTIVFVSHDMNMVKKFCGKAAWLDQGRIKMFGDVHDVVNRYEHHLKAWDHTSRSAGTSVRSSESPGYLRRINILNAARAESDTFSIGADMFVRVEYEVKDASIEIVIGVAIFGVNNVYISGLNTDLDGYRVRGKLGKNVILLRYGNLRLLEGHYYIDVGLFERNAIVAMDYRARAIEFSVEAPYVSEGIALLDHEWLEESSIT